MSDTIDINVYPIVETVTFEVTENLTTININQVTSTGAVTSVNGLTGSVTLAIPDATSQLTNDSGFITDADLPDVSGLVPFNGANTYLDLGANRLEASQIITKTNSDTKKMTLSSTNVQVERTAEWQDKDYSGIADITDIPTATSQLTNDSGFVTDISGKVDKNADVISKTATKITYDSKGLVTSSTDATTADIADSTDKRYVTDAKLTVIANTSGTNTGDNATNSQYSGLASRISQSVSIPLNSTSLSPADATTYYISPVITTASTTESTRRFKFPYATTIHTLNLNIQQVGNGSAETVSVYLRNSTGSTETLVGTFTSDFGAASMTSFNFSGLTISIPNTTDFWTLKIVCPTWTTNPTGWIINANVISN